jgi:hypothetical protein
MRQRGQTGSEYMMVISAVVVAIVGGSYAFVPPFQDGVKQLGYDIKETLRTGSFRGQGRVNATSMDTATNPNTMIEGGEQRGTQLGVIPFINLDLGALVQQALLATQRAAGGPPPIGIGNNSCGIWAVSFIFNELGIPETDMSRLMDLAKNTPGVLLSCGAASGESGCRDWSIDRWGMDKLADKTGVPVDRNPNSDFPSSKAWLEGQLGAGKHPALLVTDPQGRPHWVVVTGTVVDPETGTVTGYTFRDGRTGETQTMSRSEFQDSWAQQGMVGLAFGPPNGAATASR